ncbi:MAG: glycosyltransferase [Gammaproteobacteria bacterium]
MSLFEGIEPAAAAMIAVLSLLIWIYLCFAHGRFWQSGPQLPAAAPLQFPDVDVVVPARDEAHTVAAAIGTLLEQDYGGSFRVILVDDNSSDATAELAKSAAPAQSASRLEIISLKSKAAGWSGKLWALSQGVAAGHAPFLLFTDADIVHDPRHLSSLVAKLLHSGVDMVSEMVRLNCSSVAERALVPAFVYFFQMLYPFNQVNDPRSRVAAAAGGTVLIRRDALQRLGGIDAIKSALIDDVALAKAVKAGGAIFIGHSGLASSIRPYPHFSDIWHMVSRTAFTQLRYSMALLALTLLGLTLVWLAPVAAMLFGQGWPRACGAAAFTIALLTYVPTLRRYGQSPLWALALPLIALFYMAATLGSALEYWLGRGARWKSRAYGPD